MRVYINVPIFTYNTHTINQIIVLLYDVYSFSGLHQRSPLSSRIEIGKQARWHNSNRCYVRDVVLVGP